MCKLGSNVECAVDHGEKPQEFLSATAEELDAMEAELADPLRVQMEANRDQFFMVDDWDLPKILKIVEGPWGTNNGTSWATVVFPNDHKRITAEIRKVGLTAWYRCMTEQEITYLKYAEAPF